MKRRNVMLAALYLALPLASNARGADGNLTISDAFLRASTAMAKAGGGFMRIVNSGGADRLLAVKSDISEKAELHTSVMEDGVMKMRAVAAIDIPAGGTAELMPGGFHIMFTGLKDQLKEGTTVSVTLVFEKAGELKLEMPVKGPGAMDGD